ncbi:helix-turn-helix domain-containing protein [Patescibacteria group bacterium]|nr:helix-turn-helix domain-containing protein [Patescibacteria group bacterium]
MSIILTNKLSTLTDIQSVAYTTISMIDKKQLGSKIKDIREERGLSQEQLAKAVGL